LNKLNHINMKKIVLLSIIIPGILNLYGQTQVTLTFTGIDSVSHNPVILDSVYIQNLTEDCDTLVYGPEPVLSLIAGSPVGIEETDPKSHEAFNLEQNYPNPFEGSTVVDIYRDYRGPLDMSLYNVSGIKLAEYHNEFEKGYHSFVIHSSGNKVLILSASDDKNQQSVKIICNGQDNEASTIIYLGQNQHFEKSMSATSDSTGFIFYLGNQMMYTAYASGYFERTITDNPNTDSTYYFNMSMLTIPVVTTTTVTDITETTATSGGDVTSDGGANITGRGVCWSTSPFPTLTDSHTIDDSGTGIFSSDLNGLTPDTLYYVRAYATNSVGTAYGNELTFTTLALSLPTVTTAAVTDLAQTTATSGGNVPYDGGVTVSAKGVCWSTSPNPTTADNYTVDGIGTGQFVSYLTGLIPETQYYIRAYATNSVGTAYGNELTFTTLTATAPIVITAAVTNITQTTATSGGTVTSDGGDTVTARGVCWSISSNPTTDDSHTTDGSGTGTFVSNLSGLTLNTLYFIRAYAINNVGTSYGNEENFTTLAGFVCGDSFTINHVAGDVAPVTKTATYGTVTNIPGATSKCWITSNLGSDHQATAVNDATEASAGWYWQFNHMQGYKHTGTVRTPNTTWIYPIVENVNWQVANDPCTLELGSGWRIPTNIEWTNVDASGGWTNWNGPWNSALKMHAAGDLFEDDGSLYGRGSIGTYWSSTQYNAEQGYFLYFNNVTCNASFNYRAFGYPLRCLKD
jgi:hypothetical protein